MRNLLDYNLNEISTFMDEMGEKKFRAKQIYEWIYKKQVFSFDEMKNIPKELQSKLKEEFYIGVPKVIERYESKLDGTQKLLLCLKDKNIIESVIMKYKHGNSICVSTQVGCRMGCKFCASTLEGRVRNLTSGEILGQILAAQKISGNRISNVVLMGSGEPLDNFENVIKFLQMVTSEENLNIGQRHITLSTCGIVPKIYEFADMNMQVTLAISLHAVNDEKRRAIMPIANKYSIEEILTACKYYINKTKRRVTFEYSLVQNVNDSKEDAMELTHILKGILCHVNLIPINEIKERDYKKSNDNSVKEFSNIIKKNGIEATIRREMGADINAACGQLRKSYIESHEHNEGE